jgi:prevent-host-death family protein
MATVPTIIPISDLRQDAAGVLKSVRDSEQPVFITQRGRAAAVMLSVQAYQRGEHERELLRLLARGELEIAQGQGYDLASVLTDMDKLLAEGSK